MKIWVFSRSREHHLKEEPSTNPKELEKIFKHVHVIYINMFGIFLAKLFLVFK